MSSNKVYGARYIFSMVSQIMIGLYLCAIVALVIGSIHFLNKREDAMLEDLASAKRKMEQRKAAEERRRSAFDKEPAQPDIDANENLDSPLRQAEIKQQKKRSRARALPEKIDGTLPPPGSTESKETVSTNAVIITPSNQSEVTNTSAVEKVEKQFNQPVETDAEKKYQQIK